MRQRFRPSITGADLARKLGVSRSAVSGWLAGEYLPTPELMARIEDLTGIPMRSWTEPELEGAAELTGTEHG